MTRVDRACLLAVMIAGGLGATPFAAHAQSAEAEALFRDGRNLIKAGKLAAGCDRLAASERLESSVGTLLNLGDCREKLGKLASAWAAFRKAEAMAKRAGGDERRQAEAGHRAAALEPRLSNLVIEVGHMVDGLVVRRDDEVVDSATWNTALPVDPGSYALVAEAPGYAAWRTSIVIAAGERRHVVSVPLLERVAVAAPPAAPTRIIAAPVVRPTWTSTRMVSAVFAVAGAGAVGTGIYFGLHARSLDERANQRCPGSACSDPEGLRLNDQAQTSASRANVLYIAGAAALATAAVLWYVGAPGEVVVVPAAGDHQLGVALSGRF
ncbi:MAG: hypothetical protein E6J90_51675 [Deltaproteobacteria bacterium]|nr:MAG: hypothetical protein E6J90_51675 [Deltaproteobacteria bacterium]TMQ10671.1 MAG: hypothetical protein E6J91_25605 [Deltaproteobacteria bacterium]